ncbi:hypothetical protein BDZ89DRAFT_949992 [Hymenopellis radicata]|nr:hypothetical protein BDZ89DRAFT_949992 [Hymenopellis radicata]
MFSLFLALLLASPLLYFLPRLRSSPTRIFLGLHSIVLLHNLIIHPPPNVFTRLHLPLSTPTDVIRALLLKHSPEPNLPAHLEQLLSRMNSFDTRTLYVRFGHDTVATCEYCRSYADFAFYSLPSAAMAYVREVAVIGLVTIRGTGREHLRTVGVGALAAVAALEVYFRSSAVIQIKDGENVFMWSDMLEIFRALLFIVLPLIIDFLPPRAPSAAPHPAEHAMQALITRLHALKYYRGAIMRTPSLNNAASAWWARERQEGEWIRSDQRVQDVARGVGLPFEGDDPRLRTNARAIVREFVAAGLPAPGQN